jgi:aspartyl/asparaginyl-tRNA synthetase
MDLLVPRRRAHGGSQRERYAMLGRRIVSRDEADNYWWYLDTRHTVGAPRRLVGLSVFGDGAGVNIAM